jgi:hypothetical protein
MEGEKRKKRIVKWEHLAIRPVTFEEFRELRRFGKVGASGRFSDNFFVVELLRVYRLYLKHQKRKQNV